MTRRRLIIALALALSFIFSSVAVSAKPPRAVPPNDNFNSAQIIRIGKDYRVSDIGAATNQPGEPLASCNGNAVIPNSVWFTFSQPENSAISLSTFGSLMMTSTFHSQDTVMAVYQRDSFGTFVQQACIDNDGGSTSAQLVFYASRDVTYYIAVGTYLNFSFLPESTLKLNTRMLSTWFWPDNFSFEMPIKGSSWELINGSDDQRPCSNATYPAWEGLCTFHFVGTPGVTTRLTQTVAFPASFMPRKNAFLSTFFMFRVVDAKTIGTAKIKVVVTYGDGTPSTVRTIALTGSAANAGYYTRNYSELLESRKVESIKFTVIFASPTGGLLLDYIRFDYNADPATRGAGLLPVPPALQ